MLKITGLIVGLAGCATTIGCGQGESGERLDSVLQGIGGVPPTFCGVQMDIPPGANAVVLDATADTQLEKASPTTNQGNLETCVVKGGANERHCLLRFDLTSLATSTQVVGGCLTLVVQDPSGSNFPSYELLRNWGHTTATWQRATTGVNWERPGAWGATDSAATVVATLPKNRAGWLMVPLMTSLVQKWVATPSSNYGIVFGGSSTDGVSFSTLETDGNTPQLYVLVSP